MVPALSRRSRPGGGSTPLVQWLSVAGIILALHIAIWREFSISLPTSSSKIISRIEVELRAIEPPPRQTRIAQPPQKTTAQSQLIARQPISTSSSRRIPDSPSNSITPPIVQADVPVAASPAPVPMESPVPDPTPSNSLSETTVPPRNPAYLHNPKPIYPMAARRAGYEGKVIVRALIQTDGSAERVEVKKSSGYELLDRAALEAVRKWRFIPAKRGSEPIVEWVDIPWIFKLEEE